MFRMAPVFRTPINTFMVLALLTSSLWALAGMRSAVTAVDWPGIVSAPVSGPAAVRQSTVLAGLAGVTAKAQPPSAIPPERWAAIQETIRRDMYSYSPSISGYLADNPAQRLTLAFDAEGIIVGPAPAMKSPGAIGTEPILDAGPAAAEQAWTWGLALAGYGYESDMRPVPAATMSSGDNRLTYSRSDGSAAPLLDEWYVNEERGLEQGFTLYQAPEVGGLYRSGQMVALDLRLRGDLVPTLIGNGGTGAGQSIDFLAAGGGAGLRYGELQVEDATGRRLPSSLAFVSLAGPDGQAIRILVDDAGAVYPLIVDPLVTTLMKKLLASDGAASDNFGWSVAIDGDTIVVGAHGKSGGQGAAYVFARDWLGANNWGEMKKLTASDGAAGDEFGYSVAIDGDTIVIGAHVKSSAQGAAYVFARDLPGANAWGQAKKLTASDGASNDVFGYAVAIAGDNIVVAAPNDNYQQGSAYVFTRNEGGANNWGQWTKLTASDGAWYDGFGYSVAIDGDTIVVGAVGESDRGAAYVFAREKGWSNHWGEVTKLPAPYVGDQMFFGASVAVDGDTIVVGTLNWYGYQQGEVYVFARDWLGANNWGQVTKLTTNAVFGGDFGYPVAIDGDTIVVGCRGAYPGGEAYIFVRGKGGSNHWGQAKKLTVPNAAQGAAFGHSLAIDGDTIAIGAYVESGLQGAAYIFAVADDVWHQSTKPFALDGAAGDNFGFAVAIDGDTLVVGSPAKASYLGAVYVFGRDVGGNNYWGQVRKVTAAIGAAGDHFGAAVSLDDDIMVVGAYGDSSNTGAAYIFSRENGGANNWGQVTKLVAFDGVSGDWYGFAVGVSGDNAVVGAPAKSSGMAPALGEVYVYARDQWGANVWGEVRNIYAGDPYQNDNFGRSVAIEGETIVVGAYKKGTVMQFAVGAAYVFARDKGGAKNWGQVTKLVAADPDANDWFGLAVAVDDETIVVGAPGKSGNQGAAYVFARGLGGPNNWAQAQKLVASDPLGKNDFGASVAVDEDNIVVGAPSNLTNRGSAYFFAREKSVANNWGEMQRLIANDGLVNDHFGSSVALDEGIVVVGALGKSLSQGAVYTFIPPSSSSIGLGSSLNPSLYGQVVAVTARVRATDENPTGTPTGTVTFTLRSAIGGEPTRFVADVIPGPPQFHFSALPGTHSISVEYSGNPFFDSSTSEVLIQRVNPGAVVIPSSGATFSGTLTTTVSVDFPPWAVSQPTTVTMTYTDTAGISGTLKSLGPSFIIEAEGPGGIPVTSFSQPFNLNIRYDRADLVGIREGSLRIYFWDRTARAWVGMPCFFDVFNREVRTSSNHLTQFILMGEQEHKVFLPLVLRN
ncbi:MAG: FG-GAP repeat protein [Dehalococcoidia bacterium]|nr:FG-GAP repeat protein [Dehalococcoidia bacterium]